MNEEFMNDDILVLEDEDGKNISFEKIGSCEIDGSTYFALVPVEDNDNAEYIILKLELDENGEQNFVTIMDDDEFDKVADYFDDALFGEINYDEEN